MKHPDEQELVMYVLGDSADSGSVRQHLSDCAECRAQESSLQHVLEATAKVAVPEPDSDFEARIWARQRDALAREGRSSEPEGVAMATNVVPFWNVQRVMSVGAIAAMLLVAFLAGLYNAPPGTQIVPEDQAPSRDRILFVAMGDHLQSAKMVLVELVNADEAGEVDITAQQVRAEALLANNRLYRQTAQLTGQTAVADVLSDLERVLLEVARTSGQVPAEELDWLRERIAAGDLLFKVNVIEGQARAALTPADGDNI
ncbi:MAG: hypothetical protein GKS06_08390 [Acidobacteria bacterium]|nr:hypothetical protein [Acidobacteriota bacterium]